MKVTTKKANKNYPNFGIKKGETYYEWCFYRQRPNKSKTYPTRAQLTQNEVLQTVYSAYDDTSLDSADDVKTIADAVREAGETASSKFENMPEGLQQGDTGQRLEQQAEACESAASDLEEIGEQLEEEAGRTLPEKPAQAEGETDEEYAARLDALLDEAGFDRDGEYYDFDMDAWTWALDAEKLQEAVAGTEPDLG